MKSFNKFLKIGTLRAKDLRKNVPILQERGFTPAPWTLLVIRIVLLQSLYGVLNPLILQLYVLNYSVLIDETFQSLNWSNGDEVVLNDFKIPNLQRTHNQVVLTCKAVNTMLSSPAIASVKIKMHCKSKINCHKKFHSTVIIDKVKCLLDNSLSSVNMHFLFL